MFAVLQNTSMAALPSAKLVVTSSSSRPLARALCVELAHSTVGSKSYSLGVMVVDPGDCTKHGKVAPRQSHHVRVLSHTASGKDTFELRRKQSMSAYEVTADAVSGVRTVLLHARTMWAKRKDNVGWGSGM